MTSESNDPGREVLTDSLTRLPNRLHFDVVYRIVFAAGTRGFPVSVLLVDAPGVETAGEDAQLDFGHRLGSVTRDMDLVARLDDSHFVALLLGCNVHGARLAADRVLGALNPWMDAHASTMNVGIAAYDRDMEVPDDLMSAARVALRHAKDTPGPAIGTRD